MARTIVLSSAVATLVAIAAIAGLDARAARADADANPPAGHHCRLGFFTKEGLARHKVLVARFASSVTGVDELPNGYAVHFRGDFREAGEWIDGVRGCCPTIEYTAEFHANDGPAVVRITGADGAKDFIREEFAAILKPRG